MAGNEAVGAVVGASIHKKKKSKPIPSTAEQQEAKKLEVLIVTPRCNCVVWHGAAASGMFAACVCSFTATSRCEENNFLLRFFRCRSISLFLVEDNGWGHSLFQIRNRFVSNSPNYEVAAAIDARAQAPAYCAVFSVLGFLYVQRTYLFFQ